MKALVVGDIHIKTSNIDHISKLTDFLVALANSRNPDIIILLGDILDYHEKVIIPCLNKAYELVQRLSTRPVYILVGNHDYISNTQFLSDNHWMNAMKVWPNVKIVDKVLVEHGVTFCPYVFPGRLSEALDTVSGSTQTRILFCHQEFRGCDMGVVRSEVGDDALGFTPYIISGHIHDNQRLGDKMYYVGAPLQHSFSESEKRVVALVDLESIHVEEIPVGIGLKRTITVSVDSAGDLVVPDGSSDVRVTIVGSVSECKAFKKTAKYKSLSKTAKIVFKATTTPVNFRNTECKKFDDVCRDKIQKRLHGAALTEMFNSLFI